MSEVSRTIRIVTTDEALLASVRGAASSLEGWEISEPQSVEDLLASGPRDGDLVLLDAWLRAENVYESCRRLTGSVRSRVYVVTDERNDLAEAIASFCGATGTIRRPLSTDRLRELAESADARALPQDERGEPAEHLLPERLLQDLAGDSPSRLIDALIDPETGLFSYDYLSYKLDEEYKRARRFELPLSCVMLGFEGQADESVLGRLAGIFLNASRDTDVLGRFDQSSFLFFLPSTGPDGAETMARRIRAAIEELGLRDLVGDHLSISVGISCLPHPEIHRREDLFARAREAFHAAQMSGRDVVRTD
jgi:diguanylate cyclase (GGDEF)-like protein